VYPEQLFLFYFIHFYLHIKLIQYILELVAILAPFFRRSKVANERGDKICPGTANTVFPCSAAWVAVSEVPLTINNNSKLCI
jgi:hypothetical protein